MLHLIILPPHLCNNYDAMRILDDVSISRELPCAKSTGRLERLDAPPNIRRFIPAAETAGCFHFEIKCCQIAIFLFQIIKGGLLCYGNERTHSKWIGGCK
jgi:hypothetical protein